MSPRGFRDVESICRTYIRTKICRERERVGSIGSNDVFLAESLHRPIPTRVPVSAPADITIRKMPLLCTPAYAAEGR